MRIGRSVLLLLVIRPSSTLIGAQSASRGLYVSVLAVRCGTHRRTRPALHSPIWFGIETTDLLELNNATGVERWNERHGLKDTDLHRLLYRVRP